MEVIERLGHPPLAVNTLAQMGVLYGRIDRPEEAVHRLGQALTIASSYDMQVGAQVLVDLALTMNAMGEGEFTSAWKRHFDHEPPIGALKQVLE